MIKFIDITEKLEPEAKTEHYISIQLDAMGEAIRDLLYKRQQFSCLHEMQDKVFRFLQTEERGAHGNNQANQMAPPQSQCKQAHWLEATGIFFILSFRWVQVFPSE